MIALFPPNSNKHFPKKNGSKNVKLHNGGYLEELQRCFFESEGHQFETLYVNDQGQDILLMTYYDVPGDLLVNLELLGGKYLKVNNTASLLLARKWPFSG